MFVTQGEMKNTVSLMLGFAMKHPVMKKNSQFFSSSSFLAIVPKFFCSHFATWIADILFAACRGWCKSAVARFVEENFFLYEGRHSLFGRRNETSEKRKAQTGGPQERAVVQPQIICFLKKYIFFWDEMKIQIFD